MTCVPGGNVNRFIGGDAPFATPSITTFPHGLMANDTVPTAANATGGVNAGSPVGEIVGGIEVASSDFVATAVGRAEAIGAATASFFVGAGVGAGAAAGGGAAAGAVSRSASPPFASAAAAKA